VQAVPGHSVAVHPQVLIRVRRPVPAYDFNLPIGMSHGTNYIVQQIENAGVVLTDVTRPVVTQVLIDSRQGCQIVHIASTIHNVKPLLRVDVVKVELINGVLGQVRGSCDNNS